MGDEPKHSNASLGLSTMGRPAVLRLVLTTTGRPVRLSNDASMRARSGSGSGGTVLVRAGPSPGTTGGIRPRHEGATSWTNSMYGEGRGPREKMAAARS